MMTQPGFSDGLPTTERAVQTPPSEAELATASGLLALSDAEWNRHQEERYPGTGEIMEARHEMRRDIEVFVAPDAPAARLFTRFSPKLVLETDPVRRLRAYEAICADNFDFRKGPDGQPRERTDVKETLEASREVVGEELWDTTFEVCQQIGAVGNTELNDGDQIKSMGILGGTPNAIANRTKYGIEQIIKHGAIVETFDYLVASKEVEHATKQAQEQMGVKLDTMQSQQYEKGTVLTFDSVTLDGQQVQVRILVADNAPGRDRATTLETMGLWDEASGDPKARKVAVTTDLYKQFQEENAKEIVTWATGTKIDFIAHSAEWAGMSRYARQLLQDSLKAAVDSRSRQYARMVATGIAPELPRA
jgi:hypothetical protein